MAERVFVAGHRGLVGSALVRRLQQLGRGDTLLLRTRDELDLLDRQAVMQFFATTRPTAVLLAAARVGGIAANQRFPVEFFVENTLIQTHVIEAAARHGVERFVFFGSSCIYPRETASPIRETALHTGPLEPTNAAYAMAKLAGLTLLDACAQELGLSAVSLQPTNLYGPHDNFDPETAHVVPALMRRMHEAKRDGAPVVTVWGTGAPRRELLFVDDLATAAIQLLDDRSATGLYNVGSDDELTIAELATKLREVVGYRGELAFDPTRPDGTPQKRLDSSKLHARGWRPTTRLDEGLAATYAWYRAHAA